MTCPPPLSDLLLTLALPRSSLGWQHYRHPVDLGFLHEFELNLQWLAQVSGAFQWPQSLLNCQQLGEAPQSLCFERNSLSRFHLREHQGLNLVQGRPWNLRT